MILHEQYRKEKVNDRKIIYYPNGTSRKGVLSMIYQNEPEKADLLSMDITEEQKLKLKQLFPHVFNEDKIDFEKLRQTLGGEVDTGRERYGMTWPGKAECMKIIQQPTIATLKPCKEESVDFDDTENLFIEGDNLEILKLLQKSYYGKVKMIYIDPPYNTGKEFIYPDRYSETLDTYLAYTGQVDDKGIKFSTNTDTDGRYHSKWLNMMYPRLFLARNLLRDDGVIFVSIDDNEIENLRFLMNEVFGEECFVGQVTILCNPKGRSQDKYLATCHEYLLIYSKTILPKGALDVPKSSEDIIAEYSEKNEKGRYRELELRNTHREFGKHNRPNLYYPFYVIKDGTLSLNKVENAIEITPDWDDGFEGCWTWGKVKAEAEIEDLVAKLVNGNWKMYRKAYASTPGEVARKQLKSIWKDKRHHTEKGQKTFNELFIIKEKIFQSPKSVDVLKDAISMTQDKNAIILDFFSGSSTTAHAVFDMNKEDRGNRKFIMAQLPEPCDKNSEAYKAGYKNIADIGKERIRRVIRNIDDEQKQDSAQTIRSDETKEKHRLDLGFKVFKLDKSNFTIWDGAIEDDATGEGITKQLKLIVENIDPYSSEEDILYELLLKSGFQLTTSVNEIELAGKKVYSIENDALLLCLDRELNKEVITEMAKKEPARVICLDEGFSGNDQLKTNAVQIMKSFGVEDFRTV
ncbi:MAG: site-specific DNA-methyltransferase [Methanosarcinaceae archaeon]|nr:site-specific DNA-methyltransferase [Methanosarcinaceae archaeon]